MRQIKFKYYMQHEDTGYITSKIFELEELESYDGFQEPHRYFTFKRCQFTGLFDKQGVEVYEGDIGNDKFSNKVIVKWNEQFYCYALLTIDEVVKDDWNFDLNDLNEVVGNLYENPELLKDTK